MQLEGWFSDIFVKPFTAPFTEPLRAMGVDNRLTDTLVALGSGGATISLNRLDSNMNDGRGFIRAAMWDISNPVSASSQGGLRVISAADADRIDKFGDTYIRPIVAQVIPVAGIADTIIKLAQKQKAAREAIEKMRRTTATEIAAYNKAMEELKALEAEQKRLQDLQAELNKANAQQTSITENKFNPALLLIPLAILVLAKAGQK